MFGPSPVPSTSLRPPSPATMTAEDALPPATRAEKLFHLGSETFELKVVRAYEGQPFVNGTAAIARSSGAVAWLSRADFSIELHCSPTPSLPVKGSEDIVFIGWTDDELLVTVSRLGHIKVFEANGSEVASLYLSEELNSQKLSVDHCLISPDGCVCFTDSGRVLVVEGLSGCSDLDPNAPIVHELPVQEAQANSHILCTASFTSNGQLKVLLAVDDSSLLLCDQFYVDRIDLTSLSVPALLAMAVSPTAGFLACHHGDSLTVLNPTFDRKVQLCGF